MKKLLARYLLLGFCFGCFPVAVNAQSKTAKAEMKDHIMLNTSEFKWMDGPASLPPGAKAVAIEGDPAKAGPFTLRLIFPPNYTILPHYHPAIEHITVLEGEFFMGHGDNLDETKATSLTAGGFAVMPVKFHHFAFTKEKQAVIQLHGIGPWDIIYLDKANDPRKKK